MALPETLAELRDCIAAQHEQLTGRLRDAARFLIDNPHEIALNTVAELGKRSNIAPSAKCSRDTILAWLNSRSIPPTSLGSSNNVSPP